MFSLLLKDLISDFIFQTGSGRAQFAELALVYKQYPTSAGLFAGVKYQSQSKYIQCFNNSKNVNL